jgi:hypothetical protein
MATPRKVSGFSMHMSGNVLSLKEKKDSLLRKLEKVNEEIAAQKARIEAGDVEAGEIEPLMGTIEGETVEISYTQPAQTHRSDASTKTDEEKISSIADEDEAEKIRHHFEYPSEFSLIAFQVGMSLGYSGYVMTAWLYIGAVRHDVFPDCNHVWPFSHEMQGVCEFSILAFWTFPIFCCIFLLIFLYRDLLNTRLYYEMLCHNVYLDLENVDFFESQAVRFLLFWMGVASLMYPATGNLHIAGMKATVAYWIPVVSFMAMLYASWDLETRLVSLAKYVEREFDDAKVHMQNSVFLRDYLCRQAFERVRDTSRKMQKIHGTGSYVRAVVKMAMKMCRTEKQWSLQYQGDEHSGYDSFFVAFSRTYWVTDFLYCPQLEDKRARKFRAWFRVYFIYTFALLTFFLYLGVATIVSHLYHQRKIEESMLTRWFKVENFLVFPVGPSHSKDVTGEEGGHHGSLLLRVIDHLTRL